MKNIPNKMEVECSVETCKFWDDNYCHASKLNVRNSIPSDATTSNETCCKTFVCKD